VIRLNVTLEQVKLALSADEVEYSKLKRKFGKKASPHLEKLVKRSDPMLASKAAYLVGLINDEKSADILKKAATSKEILVRISVAATARNLSKVSSNKVFLEVLKDKSKKVQDVALRRIDKKKANSELLQKIRKFSSKAKSKSSRKTTTKKSKIRKSSSKKLS